MERVSRDARQADRHARPNSGNTPGRLQIRVNWARLTIKHCWKISSFHRPSLNGIIRLPMAPGQVFLLTGLQAPSYVLQLIMAREITFPLSPQAPGLSCR